MRVAWNANITLELDIAWECWRGPMPYEPGDPVPPSNFDGWLIAMIAAVALFATYGVGVMFQMA